jgi:hypothetical protein
VEVIDGDVERTNDDIVGLRDRYIIGIKEGWSLGLNGTSPNDGVVEIIEAGSSLG